MTSAIFTIGAIILIAVLLAWLVSEVMKIIKK